MRNSIQWGLVELSNFTLYRIVLVYSLILFCFILKLEACVVHYYKGKSWCLYWFPLRIYLPLKLSLSKSIYAGSPVDGWVRRWYQTRMDSACYGFAGMSLLWASLVYVLLCQFSLVLGFCLIALAFWINVFFAIKRNKYMEMSQWRENLWPKLSAYLYILKMFVIYLWHPGQCDE